MRIDGGSTDGCSDCQTADRSFHFFRFSFLFFFSFFFFSFFLLLFLLFRFGCLDDSGGEFAMTDLCVREHSSCAYGEW